MMAKRTGRGGGFGVSAMTAQPGIAAMATPPTTPMPALRRTRDGHADVAGEAATGAGDGAIVSVIRNLATPMSEMRFMRSFSRQRPISNRIYSGTSPEAGIADYSKVDENRPLAIHRQTRGRGVYCIRFRSRHAEARHFERRDHDSRVACPLPPVGAGGEASTAYAQRGCARDSRRRARRGARGSPR